MEIKSISDCLNLIDDMIFGKSFKIMIKNDLERIRNHIEWVQAGCVARGEFIEERVDCLSVLRQINHIVEKSYSDDTEEELDEQYNKLRQRILQWYYTINAKPEINDQE